MFKDIEINYKVDNSVVCEGKLLGYVRTSFQNAFDALGEAISEDKTPVQWKILVGNEPLYDSSAHYIFNVYAYDNKYSINKKIKILDKNEEYDWHIGGFSLETVQIAAAILKSDEYYLEQSIKEKL